MRCRRGWSRAGIVCRPRNQGAVSLPRADATARILAAAIELGTSRGTGALSIQAVGDAAGVSKALVLYHFNDKAGLLTALARSLSSALESRLRDAAQSGEIDRAWRALARDECARGESALWSALLLDPDVPGAVVEEGRAGRTAAATRLAGRMLAAVGLTPRVPVEFLGRMLLRELDGLTHAARRDGLRGEGLESELDAVTLALLALGR
jgi:AcrR family transcriptional regulator